MRSVIQSAFERIHPHFEEGGKLQWAWPVLELQETFFLTPDTKTKQGAHVRDPVDLKRVMVFVIYALLPCVVFGMWNIGHQAYLAEGMAAPSVGASFARGAWHMLPIIATSYAVGGIWEMLFAVVRKHEISEGFLVTGLLFPLTLPPSIPLWMVAMGISFGVVIGKEVFGGVGMNILNPALTARAFVFFTYPAAISGAKVWDVAGTANPVISRFSSTPVDGYTGATPLLEVAGADRGASAQATLESAGWGFQELALGLVPGSMGETSAVLCLVGALFLIAAGIASWRIMLGCVAGVLSMGIVLNTVGVGASVLTGLGGVEEYAAMIESRGGLSLIEAYQCTQAGSAVYGEPICEAGRQFVLPLTTLPPLYHLVIGSFAFGAVYMATDPVSASATLSGRWLYGFFIGVLVAIIRVLNPAYPEGVMLAILFMNVFSPLIDYFVVKRTTRRRASRLPVAA